MVVCVCGGGGGGGDAHSHWTGLNRSGLYLLE